MAISALAPAANAIILSIEKNGTEVGTITFAGGGSSEPARSAFRPMSILSRATATPCASRNRDDAAPSDLSVTLPFIRMDCLT